MFVPLQAPTINLQVVPSHASATAGPAAVAAVPINPINPVFGNPAVEGISALNGEAAVPFPNKVVILRETKPVAYFANQAVEQQQYLEATATRWEAVLEQNEGDRFDPESELYGTMNRAIGQARLLLRKRLSQFQKMCDLQKNNQTMKGGLRSRGCDLEGFWDVIMMQIDDIRSMFETLEKREADGWQTEKTVECLAPKKKKRKVNPNVHRLRKQARPGPVTPRRQAAKNRLAALKNKFKKSTFTSKNVEIAEEHSSISILTPMKASKRDREILGADVVLTPARRSTRKTPSKYRREPGAEDVSALLYKSDYAYKPNDAMSTMQSPAPFAAGNTKSAASLLLPSLGEADEGADLAAAEDEDPLSKYLFGDAKQAQVAADEGAGRTLPPLFELSSGGGAARLISLTPVCTPVSKRKGQAAYEAASKLGGMGVRFAISTPLRVPFGCNDEEEAFTPIRRSSRIERLQTPHQQRPGAQSGFQAAPTGCLLD